VTARARLIALWIGLGGLGALLGAGLSGLRPAGQGRSAYGDLLASRALPERRAQDAVAAVNFDYRAFDTLGEEFILFAAVAGVATVLRQRQDEVEAPPRPREDRSGARQPPPTSAAIRVLGAGLAGITVAFGLYVAAHGQVSPGGGFQGGVVLATAPLVVYLSSEAPVFLRVAPRWLVELGEGVGAAAFVGVGLVGLVAGKAYLENVLPLGEAGDVLSSGTILLANLAVGLEVAAGFVLLLTTFLDEALQRRLRGRGRP
jgi:multicomponent Na+:H+ antiporter subunit B